MHLPSPHCPSESLGLWLLPQKHLGVGSLSLMFRGRPMRSGRLPQSKDQRTSPHATETPKTVLKTPEPEPRTIPRPHPRHCSLGTSAGTCEPGAPCPLPPALCPWRPSQARPALQLPQLCPASQGFGEELVVPLAFPGTLRSQPHSRPAPGFLQTSAWRKECSPGFWRNWKKNAEERALWDLILPQTSSVATADTEPGS